MRAQGWRAWLAALAVAMAATSPAGAAAPPDTAAAGPVPPAQALPFDPAHSRVGFRLRTRWGQSMRGHFPAYEGEVRVQPDGMREVRVRLDTARMEILGQPRYTRWALGPEFFDAARHPVIEFVSERYGATRLRDGGMLHGTLTLRGHARPVRFTLEPATCDAPGIDCDVVAHGTVDRTDFGMDGWRMVVGDDVRFELRVRTQPGAGR